MRPGDVGANYNLGVLLRVSGRPEQALECLRLAAAHPEHPDAARARELIDKMRSPAGRSLRDPA
jgi:Tfp pilus assembly protein PilF